MDGIAIGTMRLDLLPDAEIGISGDSVFAPAERAEWSAHVTADGEGRFTIPVRPLLIRGHDSTILVDTGFGDIASLADDTAPVGRTLDALKTLGVSPDDVDTVIITHAHGDHFQGNMRRAEGRNVAAFRNAQFVLHRAEAAAARADNRDEWETYFAPIERAGRLRLLDGDAQLTESVGCVPTPGHTVGHQSVVVSDAGESACYLGDLALHLLNLQKPQWAADWAWSREKDRENRIGMCEWARDNHGILILPHDGENSFVMVDDDLVARPLTVDG